MGSAPLGPCSEPSQRDHEGTDKDWRQKEKKNRKGNQEYSADNDAANDNDVCLKMQHGQYRNQSLFLRLLSPYRKIGQQPDSMSNPIMQSSSSILFFFLFCSTTMFAATSAADIKGAYWPSWLQNTLPPSEIPTSYYTHVFYAFVGITSPNYQLVVKPEDNQWMPTFTSSLHSRTPRVVTMLSIGGGGSSTSDFSDMASNPTNRANFITSTINVARQYGFDGLDLDWEYPLTQAEMDNFGTLLTEWRRALEAEGDGTGMPRLLLTAAVYFKPSAYILSSELTTYPAHAVRDSLDFLNLMCYDYRGEWDTSKTGAHALLYDSSSPTISTSYGIQAWINAGLPRNKLILGLAAYGRSWKLSNPNVNGIGAPAVGVGPGGGTVTYANVVDFNAVAGTIVVYDDNTVSMYSYRGTDWIGYDGPTTIDVKVQYALDNSLGGYFFWAIGQDKNWELSIQAMRTWARQASIRRTTAYLK